MYERTVTLGELTIEWAQQSRDSAIFGRVVAPVQSEIFASVGLRLDGRYVLTLSPRGKAADYSTYRHAFYLTREKAMTHAERWVASRWRHVPQFKSKISMAGRGNPSAISPVDSSLG